MDATGSGKYELVASKLEIRISQPVHKIATKFLRLTYIFGIQLSSNDCDKVVLPNEKKPEVKNPRWRPLNFK